MQNIISGGSYEHMSSSSESSHNNLWAQRPSKKKMFLVQISAKKQGSGAFFFLSQSNKLLYSLVRKIHAILKPLFKFCLNEYAAKHDEA